MNRTILMAATALAAMSAPALAAEEVGMRTPQPCAATEDTRVRCIAVTTDRLIYLPAARGQSLLIEVPEGEKVVGVPTSDDRLMRGRSAAVRVALDDGEADGQERADGPARDDNLSVAVRGPTVVLKPHKDLLPQPFFVLTERDGKQNRYRFQLQTVRDTEAYFSVRLRNVSVEAAGRAQQWRERNAQREREATEARLAAFQAAPCASSPGANMRYVAQGENQSIAPAEVCDTGAVTYMRFPGRQRIPSMALDLPDGTRASVNWTTLKDGWIQISSISTRFTLTDGLEALCVLNRGYNPVGRATGTGTLTPGVIRVPAREEPAS